MGSAILRFDVLGGQTPVQQYMISSGTTAEERRRLKRHIIRELKKRGAIILPTDENFTKAYTSTR